MSHIPIVNSQQSLQDRYDRLATEHERALRRLDFAHDTIEALLDENAELGGQFHADIIE